MIRSMCNCSAFSGGSGKGDTVPIFKSNLKRLNLVVAFSLAADSENLTIKATNDNSALSFSNGEQRKFSTRFALPRRRR